MAITESLMKERKIFVTMATKQSFQIYNQNGVSSPLRFNIANGTASIIEMSNGHSKVNGNSSPSEKGDFEDDELTNLTWLQDTNLLRNIQMGTCGEAEEVLHDSRASDLFEDAAEEGSDKVDVSTGNPFSNKSTFSEPYNPQVHINAKPPYSFSCLIFMAIEDSPVKALAVKDIYSWILSHFPYFQHAPTGWKNSVRHNLSLNKCFSKVEKIKGQNIGKGSLWCIDPQFRPNLLQALRKSPSSSFSHMPSLDYIMRSDADNNCDKPLPLAPTQSNINLPSPELFPYLSKRLNASTVKDPEVDAAATMLALKNGPSVRSMHSKCNFLMYSEMNTIILSLLENVSIVVLAVFKTSLFQGTSMQTNVISGIQSKYHHNETPVVTNSPSEDHNYSASLASYGENRPSSVSPASLRIDISDGSDVEDESSDSSSESSQEPTRGTLNRKARIRSDCAEKRPLNGLSRKRMKIKSTDTEDEQTLAEGAHALLNFVKIATSKRYIFQPSNDVAENALSDR
ncbi:forkhead box protein N3-like [Limulus polyphemus]|uniref:Forkhead box protein N3 n=1 Tax=Limulus polyphemus TaxID=6850 RepID=A0ABM1T0L7_LIMPO|nr:forkhead box protein N3-like [Limulus polyphemus]